MSEYMIDDLNVINDINPYVKYGHLLPGTSRQPHDFEQSINMIDNTKHKDEKSIACHHIASQGWGAVQMCSKKEPNCITNRPIIPQRNIDYGFTKTTNKNMDMIEFFRNEGDKIVKNCDITFFILITIVVILLIVKL